MAAPKRHRVGRREHQWLYGGPSCWTREPYEFCPTNHGKPPAVLRRLVAKGWMWADKRQIRFWMPRNQEWSGPQPAPEHWCGLTEKGLSIIEERKAASIGASVNA